jgi:O-succinylbenzoic acid--CoA ligase
MESVNCPISENARQTPHHCALMSQEHTWTYQELNLRIDALCQWLKDRGVKENHRVAFIAHSSAETIVLFFALFRMHAIACPLSFRIPEEQIPSYLGLLKPSLFLEPGSLFPRLSVNCSHSHLIPLDQLATFLLTSGSSGTPKIACHTFGNHYYNALGVIPPLQLEPSSRWLLSLPLFHVSGVAILFRSFFSGSTVVLANLTDFNGIHELKISHISFVPTQLYRLLKDHQSIEKIKRSLKTLLLGGAPIPPSLLNRALAISLPVLTTYGMTEMSSIITLSSGTLPHRNIKIEKDNEIWTGGRTLFKGYWNVARETIDEVDQEGWFPTKDLGQWTDGHQLEVMGRKDRQFISGGENIQPEEIERALCSLAGIRQASVLPIADGEYGARPVAFIDDEAGKYSLETIRDGLRPLLPAFMHPIHIFSYPFESGTKPNLAALKRHLSEVLYLNRP